MLSTEDGLQEAELCSRNLWHQLWEQMDNHAPLHFSLLKSL